LLRSKCISRQFCRFISTRQIMYYRMCIKETLFYNQVYFKEYSVIINNRNLKDAYRILQRTIIAAKIVE